MEEEKQKSISGTQSEVRDGGEKMEEREVPDEDNTRAGTSQPTNYENFVSENHCKACDRGFASKIKLKRHQSLKHTKSDTQETNRSEEYKCESCDKYFSTKGNLKLHIVNKRCSYQAENVSTLKDNKKRRNLSQAERECNVNAKANEDLISEEINDDSIRIEFDDSDDDENEIETNNEKLTKDDENVNKAKFFPVIEFDDSDSD